VVQHFSTNSSSPTAPTPTSVSSPSSASPSFQNSVKINILYYPKLKDENQWRTFNRQLHSIAASHDKIDVLDPTSVPRLEDQDSFCKEQWFMYSVFSILVLTTKGKNCIHDECDSMDAQKVYAALLEAYLDPLT
jgi:hypothetical protein